MEEYQGVVAKIRSFTATFKHFLFRNTGDTQTVAKNTVWLSISNFGGRLLKAVVIIYAARVLDPARWGLVSYAVTLAGFFTLFVDPGINAVLMREGAKAEETHQRKLFSTTFYIKVVLIVAVTLFVLFIGPSFSILPGAKFFLPIAALIIVGDSLREFFSSFIRAKEKMERETAVFLFTNFCIVAFGFVALLAFHSARSFGWAYAAGTTIGALAALWMIRAYLRDIFANFSSSLVPSILRSAWPFAVTGALGALLTNADILIISWMRPAASVGIYSAAVRIIQALYLFPVVIQYATLPLFSRLARKNDWRLREVLEHAVIVIFAVSIPIALCGLFLGGPIMTFVFGSAYAAGGMSLTLLLLTMIVDYPGGVIGVAIFAYDRQKALINASIIGGVTNVAFDLLLIPRFGITGSAVATLIAQTLNNAYLWHVMRDINSFEVISRLKRITLASVATALASGAMLILHINLALIIAADLFLYIILLKLLNEPLLANIRSIIESRGATSSGGEVSGMGGVAAATEKTRHARVRIAESVLEVEVAKDMTAIRRGLSGREALTSGTGMLFLFPYPKRYRFWMRDMRFPIDIIWIKGDEIVGITENVTPESSVVDSNPRLRFYYAPKPADRVLETEAGFTTANGIMPGDRVAIEGAEGVFRIVSAEDGQKQVWNQFVIANHPPIGAFLQSWEWADFQEKLGWKTDRQCVLEKENVAAVFGVMRYKLPFGFSHGYVPRGPVIGKEYATEEERHFEILQAIKVWAKSLPQSVIFLRLEPSLPKLSADSARYGFRRPSYYIQPRHNTAVPLDREENEILAGFHSSTRSNINRAVKRGVTVEQKRVMTENDCREFFAMINSTVKRTGGKNVYPDEHYLRTFLEFVPLADGSAAIDPAVLTLGIFWGLQNGETAAAHIVVFFGGTATYLFGASYADKLNSKVETVLHWSAMREAKRLGMRYYDLGGIDERIWPSLTAFKRQFGGEEFHYMGDIDVPLHPIWYAMYNFSKKALKKIRGQG